MANLVVRFLDMGLGDCIVVRLPGGQVLMVDCGSRRDLPDTSQLWNHMRDLVGSRIDALVLTHPDSDHYNHLERVVPENTVTINAVYHSAQRVDYQGFGSLVASGWWGLNDSKVHAVTLNSTGCTVGTATVAKKQNGQPVGLRERDSRGFLKILQSTTNPACNVWVLASNVASLHQSDSERRNAGSVVTLIEYGSTKVLLTGDARMETEAFLAYASATLGNMTLVQLPHHGSARQTFSSTFIQQLNPRMAVASTIAQNGDWLPDRAMLREYAQYASTLPNSASNTLRCWDVARQVPTQKRKRGSAVTVLEDIWDIVTLSTTKKLWSTEGHYVEIELDSNGTEVS
jgi:beta-lactamase superfamily II metal-dependent hydrolase